MPRILIVDDLPDNRYMLEMLLKGNGYQIVAASNGVEALERARNEPPDLVVTDILMPVMDGFALCRAWKDDATLKAIPFVFYTATYTDPQDEQFALSLGADRFIIKPQRPEELMRIIRTVLEQAMAGRLLPAGTQPPGGQDYLAEYNATLFRKLQKKMVQLETTNAALEREMVERKRIEQELMYRNTILLTQQETSLDAILVVDGEGRMVSYNQRFIDLWSIPPEVIAAKSDDRALQFVIARITDPDAFLSKVKSLYADRTSTSRDMIELKDQRILDRYSSPIVSEDGRYYGRVWYFRDITEQRRLEEQLLQAQKMEAVGALASGLAHDFNNILSAIIGYASLLLRKIKPGNGLAHGVEEILAASERAATLTRSMLAFSRKQAMELRPVDVNGIIAGIEKILSRLIGEDIEFAIRPFEDALIAEADAGQIEHVLINLFTNARDAMPRAGKLTIRTLRRDLYAEEDQIPAGSYAVISVSDTGCGIDKETREHIFEPFFTTKEVGKGTGLGLAMAYGIVQKHKGHIRVASEPGAGTTFTIYLPLSAGDVPETKQAADELLPRGTETILLVEDNKNVRLVTREMLQECGYRVVEAADGEDALRVFQESPDRIGLLVCDLIMPKKSGKETYAEISRIRPGLKAVFTSGYTADIIAEKGLLEDNVNFLSKPVSMIDLARKVRAVLDS